MNITSESKINSYLSFKLGNELFAAHASKVLNILEMCRITEVPKAPEYFMGIINLRSTVLPVVDLRLKLGMSPTETTVSTCIIVLDIAIGMESILLGVIVDSVQAVVEFEKKDILPPPSIGSKYRSEFIVGVTNINDNFIMVLDMDAIFSTDELVIMLEKTEGKYKNETVEIVEG
jgi:purine-binding chemotaxis protein CheW